MKKIGLIAGNISEGLAYQRLHLPFRALKEEYEIKCFDLGDIRNSDLFYLDALVMCHAWSPKHFELIEKAKTWYGLKVIVDIDDLLHQLPSDHEDYHRVAPFQQVAHILQAADHVTVSTEYLRTAYGHLNSSITVVPNTIDRRSKDLAQAPYRPHKNAWCVGWTGGQSHRSDQFEMLPGLTKFFDEHPDTRGYFHVLCPQNLLNKFGAQIHFESQPVYFLDYPVVAARYPFDVCLVPLINHPFNDAKSDLRLLDMAVNNIPLIVSPRSDFIRHRSRNICLYADDNEPEFMSWNEAIEFAYRNPLKMEIMAAAAKQYVYAERCSDVATNLYRDILQKLL